MVRGRKSTYQLGILEEFQPRSETQTIQQHHPVSTARQLVGYQEVGWARLEEEKISGI